VSAWSGVFLGIIALATLTMAVVQVGIIVVAARLARRVDQLADQVEHEMKPLFAHLDAIGRDASRAASLAAAQVERVDQVFADLAMKVEQTATSLQTSILEPVREGRALLRALRAGFDAVRGLRSDGRRQGRGDDEDALFI
jgi:uncharacterized membrane-anchored protein YhcB (DUF1043 family)